MPGNRWVYESQGEDAETITVTVTDETRVVAGVTTTVVSDVVTDADGQVVEETFDWFAQDRDGNVWYFGEDTTEYDDRGRPDTAGSWEAGVDGAQAGLVMPATPRVGDGFRQEYRRARPRTRRPCSRSTTPARSGSAPTPTWWSPRTPPRWSRTSSSGSTTRRGVGLIFEETVSGGTDRVELVSFTEG